MKNMRVKNLVTLTILTDVTEQVTITGDSLYITHKPKRARLRALDCLLGKGLVWFLLTEIIFNLL
jgi:hypothetical protein